MRRLVFVLAGVFPAIGIAVGCGDHSAIVGVFGICLLMFSPLLMN